MKKMMTVIAIIFILFATGMNAQESRTKISMNEKRVASAKKNALMGLRSGNNGLIEASLILIARIKMNFPETNIAEVKPVIDSIAFTKFSGALQYEAYLTTNICSDPEWFSADSMVRHSELEVFFLSVSQRLQNKLLGMNSF